MRKLLLATVAALGASMGVATVADAQTTSPAPGTVTVRLNGRFRFYGVIVNDRDADVGAPASGSGAGFVGAGGNKQSNYGFENYARLYPGFDGVAANGLKYGASLEIRQDTSAPAGGGINGSISASNPRRSQLYFRREWGYFGTNELGNIRLGSTDQPTSLYMTGNFENFNSGGLNGDLPGLATGNTAITWPFSDVGSYYITRKAVYLSPQLFGFDAGVSYEPDTGAVNNSNNCPTSTSGPGCDRLSSTNINGETARRRNSVDALVRYRGTFAGFGIAATAAYLGGSHVQDNQTGVAFNNNPLNGAPLRRDYDGLNAGDFGVALSYAGFSVGGKYTFGRFNGGVSGLAAKGASDSQAWLVGASYTVGPLIVGAHYLDYQSAGDLNNDFFGRQRRERGVAAGATYALAPGVSLFAEYLFQERRQNGLDLRTGNGVTAATGSAGSGNSNKLSSNIFALGTSFTW